jgi:hypothetical protein
MCFLASLLVLCALTWHADYARFLLNQTTFDENVFRVHLVNTSSLECLLLADGLDGELAYFSVPSPGASVLALVAVVRCGTLTLLGQHASSLTLMGDEYYSTGD